MNKADKMRKTFSIIETILLTACLLTLVTDVIMFMAEIDNEPVKKALRSVWVPLSSAGAVRYLICESIKEDRIAHRPDAVERRHIQERLWKAECEAFIKKMHGNHVIGKDKL